MDSDTLVCLVPMFAIVYIFTILFLVARRR